jgi:formylglycine-generating enzyme required for sulfatase activity
LWGIYLVDVFDNRTLLKELPGNVLFEPVPLKKVTPPPVIPDRVDPSRQDAVVYLTDVYSGPGLKGVPKGTVKKLRLFEVHYGYPQMGGHVNVAVEGAWDVHRILGTGPVQEDGAAMVRVPANLPIALQPRDAEGKAIQLMRSWFTAMPGETLSCAGCHESQNQTPLPKLTLANRQAPTEIEPWYGPARGFSFKREVQPVLDKYCVGCHDGGERAGGKIPDFSRKEKDTIGVDGNPFTSAYLALHPYVRRPGPESDYALGEPMEYYADTSELIQILKKGHHGVELDAEAWERLYAWIDLNVPDHGNWTEHRPIPGNFHERRMEMRKLLANRPEDPEILPPVPQPPAFQHPQRPEKPAPIATKPAQWPLSAEEARKLQEAAGSQTRRTLDLGEGVKMDFVLIPAGEFVMGDPNGTPDENVQACVRIDNPFWLSVKEVSLGQFQRFDALHDNRIVDQQHKDHTTPGYPIKDPNHPVIRVSWQEAVAFCEWLAKTSGEKCALPTEAQWEWACRAGADTPLNFGDNDTDFSKHANLADKSMERLCVRGINPQPINNPSPLEAFLPMDRRFDDGERIVTTVGRYQPNAWGLHDMHGNVAEWTRSLHCSYPYQDADGRNALKGEGNRVVRGGSWHDRPYRATSAFRLNYRPWQKVSDVGFRVAIELEDAPRVAQSSR